MAESAHLRMFPATQQRLRLSGGTELAVVTAGNPSNPALLLLHGFPSSARTFREIVSVLAETVQVIAPDLPGFGQSDVLPSPSFSALSDAISETLDRFGIGPRYVYLHDFGAPVGLQIAMNAPELVSGLIIQNANAHRTGSDLSGARPSPTGRSPIPRMKLRPPHI